MRTLALELAVQSAAGARVALDAWAHRVELCSALGATGGISPSLALIEQVVGVGVPVHVLIRTRGGPFVYDAEEIAAMARDAGLAVRLGAAGVVFGALTRRGAVDTDAVARISHAARAGDPRAEITFHRAFDVLIGRGQARVSLEQLVDLGCTRILTSGGAARSVDGAQVLGALVRQAQARVQIMAGGGVRPDDIAALGRTGVDAVHLSAKRSVGVPGLSAGPGGGDHLIEVTDPDIARAARLAVDRAAPGGP